MRHSAARWLALIALAAAPTAAAAQGGGTPANPSPNPAGDAAQPAQQPAANKQVDMRVVGLSGATRAGIGDRIRVKVQGLRDAMDANVTDTMQFVLYLQHYEIKELPVAAMDRDAETVEFKLARTDSSRGAWEALIGSPTFGERVRRVQVGVGIVGKHELPTAGPAKARILALEVLDGPRLALAGFGFMAALLAFWWMLRRSDILRDAPVDPAHPDPEPTAKNPTPRRPYSLARTQAAFWFFLITGAFVFLYLLLGVYDTLTPQALALLGIGSATTLAAVFIDDNRRDADKANAALDGKAPKQRVSEDFLKDVLTAEDGVSLHRFQMLVWTLVLGWMFCDGVWRNLGMPEFSSNLIALMGLSSFTYLGFKITEKPDSAADPAKADGAAKPPAAEQPAPPPAQQPAAEQPAQQPAQQAAEQPAQQPAAGGEVQLGEIGIVGDAAKPA